MAWERRASHPMLVLEAFGNRRFSIAMAAVALAVFALMGALFVLTQYLQFSLGYSALATGVRILPIAAVLAAAALVSTRLDRWLGTKVVVAAGLVIVASGLWQLTTLTASSGFAEALGERCYSASGPGSSLHRQRRRSWGRCRRERAGVGSATNSTSLQVGGALGVAVIGSVLSSRYQSSLVPVLSGRSVPAAAAHAILGSIGGALTVAGMAGGKLGHETRISSSCGLHRRDARVLTGGCNRRRSQRGARGDRPAGAESQTTAESLLAPRCHGAPTGVTSPVSSRKCWCRKG